MDVSVVVPLYNEIDNAAPLCARLTEVLGGMDREYEILLVDDGSTDGTTVELRRLAAADSRLRVVELRRNYGQSAAMHAGMRHASGDCIVTIDGDLQNDPDDIPMMVAKVEEGYDVVHGWRRNRRDPWLSRKLPSKIANWIISRATGFPIHDLGCTLKAMRRDIAQQIELYGEMHRFIPILAHWHGARCTEVVTRHHPRRHGVSKYGIGRTFRVLLDLVTVRYMLRYFASPMKLFGSFGLWLMFFSMLFGVVTVAMKLAGGVDMTGNPLLLLSALSAIVSVQFFSLGLLGETSARIYYGSPGKQTYDIRSMTNFPADEANSTRAPAKSHDATIRLPGAATGQERRSA